MARSPAAGPVPPVVALGASQGGRKEAACRPGWDRPCHLGWAVSSEDLEPSNILSQQRASGLLESSVGAQ